VLPITRPQLRGGASQTLSYQDSGFLLAGARPGELRVLTWSHLHLSNDLPLVMVWRTETAGGDTKTRRSRRILTLPRRCVDVLRDLQEHRGWIRQQMTDSHSAFPRSGTSLIDREPHRNEPREAQLTGYPDSRNGRRSRAAIAMLSRGDAAP